jgi:hypothetical protein
VLALDAARGGLLAWPPGNGPTEPRLLFSPFAAGRVALSLPADAAAVGRVAEQVGRGTTP